MSSNSFTWIRRLRIGVLAALAAGTTHGSVCSMKDIRHNAIGGTMSFVKTYTSDLWTALMPPAAEVVNVRGDGSSEE